jgi:hypothetical protein
VAPRGEHVVVVAGAPAAPLPDDDAVREALEAALAAGADRRQAVAEVTAALGVPKRVVYDVSLRIGR